MKQECPVRAGRKFECWMLKKTPALARLEQIFLTEQITGREISWLISYLDFLLGP